MAIDDALAEVDRLVEAFVAKEPVPGVAYGVIVGGELVRTRGLGTADESCHESRPPQEPEGESEDSTDPAKSEEGWGMKGRA